MANTRFQHKRSTVSGVVPTTSDIAAGELGLNLADRRIFTSNGSAVFELGSNLTNVAVSGNVTIGSTGDIVLTPGAGIVANGSLGTAGQVLSSNGTSVYWTTVATGGVRSVSITTASTITPTSDTADQYNVTALASSPATIAAPSGSPTNGQKLVIRLKDDGTGRTLSWTTTSGGYRAIGVTLPNTTVANKTTYVGCIYNATDLFWDVVASVTEA